MSVNLELYRIFHTVANAGSISQAARDLYISQPAVTQAVKQLERELGGALFIRSAKGVTLTREGELLKEHVSQALEALQIGEGRFSEMLSLERGHIRIGASDSICKHYLLPYLDAFHQAHPHLEIHVTNRMTSETISLVKSGQADIGFVNLPIEEDPHISVFPCMELHDCFVAGKKYFDILPSIKDLETLSKYPILLLEQESNTRSRLDEHLAKLGVPIKPTVELGSMDLLAEFSRIGLGIAGVIEEFVTAELESGTLRKVDLVEKFPPRAIGLIHMSQIPIPHAAEQFTKLILV